MKSYGKYFTIIEITSSLNYCLTQYKLYIIAKLISKYSHRNVYSYVYTNSITRTGAHGHRRTDGHADNS